MTGLDLRRPLTCGLAALAATLLIVLCSQPAGAQTAPPPYHVSGNKVLGKHDQQFVPQGFVLDCAAFDLPVNTLCRGETNQDPWPGGRMLTAAAHFWHADVIRLQVAGEQLMPATDTIDKTYLKLVDGLVAKATALHLVTILSLQTEYYNGPALPTASAVSFWSFMARHFKSNRYVMFDLYNEPRLLTSTTPPVLTEKRLWNIWQHGGKYDGTTYVGDQALINAIRATHARNVIIAESNDHDRDLSLLKSHLLSDPDGNVVYGVEPNLSAKHETRPEWAKYFGDLAHTLPIFPEALLPRFQECNRNAPTIFPKLLDYLGQIHMGAIVWTLLSGVTTVGTQLDNPTTFAPSRAKTDPCLKKGTPVTKHTTYGEGGDVLKFFKKGL